MRNCQYSGGVGTVIYNNVSGAFNGTLGSAVTTIASVTLSNTDGATLKTPLGKSALDLGTAGRDTRYGYALVQARAAYDRIRSYGCGNSEKSSLARLFSCRPLRLT